MKELEKLSRRAYLDVTDEFKDLTNAQFEELVRVLESYYQKGPDGFLKTIRKIMTGKINSKEIKQQEAQEMKDTRRIDIIARIFDQKDTYNALRIVFSSCVEATNQTQAFDMFNRRISNYQRTHKSLNTPKQNRLGHLAVLICMERKRNWR